MKEKLIRFMMGRYGVDALNNTLFWSAFVLILLNLFMQSGWLLIVGYGLWGWSIYRMFSRQIYKRSQENTVFLTKTKKIRHLGSSFVKNRKDKQNHYFVCPNCSQIVRVPKGRGKIEITCPVCRTHFDRKS